MSLSAATLRAVFERWLEAELREPDEALRMVLRRRARDFGADDGPRAWLETIALQSLYSDPSSVVPADTLDVLLLEAQGWVAEAMSLSEGVSQNSEQKDFGVESLIMLRRALLEALRLGTPQDERVRHAIWWKMHVLADEGRCRFWHWKGRVREVRPGLSRDAAIAQRTKLKARLGPWCVRADAALKAALAPALSRFVAMWLDSGESLPPRNAGANPLVAARYALLEVPDPISKRSAKVSAWAIRCSYPVAVASYARQCVHAGMRASSVVLMLPDDASVLAWRDHARELVLAGQPYQAPWGPAWMDSEVVRAWLQVLAYIEAPQEELALYALLVGPSFGAEDTVDIHALPDDLAASVRHLSAAAERGLKALWSAWLERAPLSVAIEHMYGAAWLRSIYLAIAREIDAFSDLHGDQTRGALAAFEHSLSRIWPGAPMVGPSDAVRLVSTSTLDEQPAEVVMLLEPTHPHASPLPKISAATRLVLASVAGSPVDGWTSQHAKGRAENVTQAARADGPSLGALARSELLRAPGTPSSVRSVASSST